MGTLMSLLVKLGIDSADFEQGINKAQASADKLGSGLASMGGSIVTGGLVAVGAAATAMGAGLVSAIGSASDLNETVSKIGVVFGKHSLIVEEFGKNAAASMGMSENAALTAAGTYGNLFVSMGMTTGKSAEMSMSMVQLAGDLASFNNMNPTDVLDKLRAGLTGETEPLKSLGVNLSAAAVESKAMAMGLVKGKEALSASAKAQATYALIMEQTTTAQGDFARTSSGLANQQRIMGATFEDMKAKLGSALLPTVNELAKAFTDWLSSPEIQNGVADLGAQIAAFAKQAVEYIPVAIGWFKQLGNWLVNNKGVIVGVLAALGAAVVAFGISVMVPLLPVIAVMALIGLAAYLLYQAWTTNFGGIQTTLTTFWTGTLQPIFTQLWTWLQVNIPVALAWLSNVWQTVLLPGIQAVVNWIMTTLVPMWQAEINWLQVAIPAALSWLSNIWQTVLLPAITAVWSWMSTVLFPFLQSMNDFFGAVFGVAITAMAGLWEKTLLPALQAVWNYISPTLMPGLQSLADYFKGPFFEAVKSAADFVGDKLTQAFDWLSKAIGSVTSKIESLAQSLKNIKLPSWMTPGSPTPWEIGLVGVSDAMDQLSGRSMPKLEAELGFTTPSGVMGAGTGGGQTTNMGGITILVSGADSPKATGDAIALRLASYGKQYQGM